MCDTETDQEQTSFPADVEWAKQQGATIEHFNLAQQPTAFEDNSTAKAFLERSGAEALPLILVDGEVALAGRYPNRNELARWVDVTPKEEDEESSCCGGCC